MKRLFIRNISILLFIMIFMTGIPANVSANFTDVPANSSYEVALNNLISLGIFDSSEKNFYPNNLLTREQFSKIICIAAGLENLADSMKSIATFSDIKVNSASNGYINAAVNKGYIKGMSDGKFHPGEQITYAQLCSYLVLALGYTSSDLSGTWPSNFISKADELGLTEGITLKDNGGVSRWQAVIMIDRFLSTDVKKASSTDADMSFLDSTGYYKKCIVFGNSDTLPYLTDGQVLTDIGTFNNPSNIKLELGSENYIVVKNGNIQKAASNTSALKISVDQAVNNKVSYTEGNVSKSMVLPENITYYYQQAKIEYSAVLPLLQRNSSIVFNYDSEKAGISYAVIFDPVYGNLEIANNFVPSSGKLGTISFGSNPLIVRDNEIIDKSQIENKDVVYQVTNIWNKNKYFLVIDEKVGGKITAITPNRLAPKTIEIDGVSYEFSKDIDFNKINALNIDLSTDNNIIVYLGHDGKVVNVQSFATEDNSDFAMVLGTDKSRYYDELSDEEKYTYSAKLLFSDGVIATYDVPSDPSDLYGKLVKFKFVDPYTVALEQIVYGYNGQTYADKQERMLGDSFVADNVKIFNIVYNDSGSEITVNLLRWSDIPGGTIPYGKVLYTRKSGAFNDVDVILTDDILNQRYKTGVVKSLSGSEYTVLIGTQEYKYSGNAPGMTVGSVFKFKMNSEGIASAIDTVTPVEFETNTVVQALDSRRIKFNYSTYYFNSNMTVYYWDSKGVIKQIPLDDVEIDSNYSKVSIYTDNSFDKTSKVNVILLSE